MTLIFAVVYGMVEGGPKVVLVSFPMVLFVGGGFLVFLRAAAKDRKKECGKYEQAGSVAEEALNNVKTVQAQNAQETESLSYNSFLGAARKDQENIGFWKAFGFGMIFMGYY